MPAAFYPEDTWQSDVERRLHILETAPRLPNSSIGSGGLDVVGGNIQIFDALNALLVTMDQDGLNIGPNLVVLDDTGLTVSGGKVRAIDIDLKSATFLNASLSTTESWLSSVSHTVPSWTTQILSIVSVYQQITNSSGGVQGTEAGIRVEGVFKGSNTQDVANGQIGLASRTEVGVYTSWAGTFDIDQRARVTASTSSANAGSVASLAIFLR